MIPRLGGTRRGQFFSRGPGGKSAIASNCECRKCQSRDRHRRPTGHGEGTRRTCPSGVVAAQFPEQFEGEESRAVAVAEGDFVGVVAGGLHGGDRDGGAA